MTDIPIIFSAPMVQALLAGRKTMTRRLLYAVRKFRGHGPRELQGHPPIERRSPITGFPVDYGVGESYDLTGWAKVRPGDRLWVRENMQRYLDAGTYPIARYAVDLKKVNSVPWQWKNNHLNSIHMPRWASRLTLVVTANRIERLQDITEADAEAEGVRASEAFCIDPLRRQFARLWSSLHGLEAWDLNPWVVPMTFTVHRTNIDKLAAA